LHILLLLLPPMNINASLLFSLFYSTGRLTVLLIII
jgi:hypothetical protein